jgi:hypothetical protein
MRTLTYLESKDLNLPLSLIAAVLVIFFLKMMTPSGNWRSKVRRIDWT